MSTPGITDAGSCFLITNISQEFEAKIGKDRMVLSGTHAELVYA
jgi:hypothetical protein